MVLGLLNKLKFELKNNVPKLFLTNSLVDYISIVIKRIFYK